MTKNVKDIEGVGPKYAEILSANGIKTVSHLLEAGASRKGRSDLANQASISESKILKWVNMCDLFRIKGVAGQYAELLEASGVDTVRELKNRNSENLTEKMQQVNKEKKLCKVSPGLKSVSNWIEQAKQLPPKVNY